MLVWSVLKYILKMKYICLCFDFMSLFKNTSLLLLKTIAELQKGTDALKLEKQNLERRFEASTKEAKGNRSKDPYVCYSYCNLY